MKQAKLIDFKNNTKALLSIVEKKADDGDFHSAIGMLRNALKTSPKNTEIMLTLADTLGDVGFYEQAINVWFKYLTICSKNERGNAYVGLALNFLHINDSLAAAYYIEKNFTEFSPEEVNLEPFRDYFADETFSELKNKGFMFYDDIKAGEYAEISSEIRKSALSDDIENALKLLDKLPKNSVEYINGLISCSIYYLMKEDGKNALNYAKCAVEIDNNNFDAVCNISTVLFYIENYDKCAEYCIKAYQLAGDDVEKLNNLATMFCQQNKHQKAYEVFNKLQSFTDMNLNMLFLFGLVAYNVCDFKKSIECFRKVIQFSGDDRIAGYYLDMAIEKEKEGVLDKVTPFAYIFQVPAVERQNRLKRIDKLLNEVRSGNYPKSISNEDMSVLKWCFSTGEKELIKIATILMTSSIKPDFSYLLQMLLDVTFSNSNKRLLIRALAICGYTKNIDFVAYSILRHVKFIKPSFFDSDISSISILLTDAYAEAFSYTALLTDKKIDFLPVVENLYVIFSSVYSATDDIPFDAKTIGAYIAEQCGLSQIANITNVVGYFEGDALGYQKLKELVEGFCL